MRTFIDLFTLENDNKMGFFDARTRKKGNGCLKANTPQVKDPETADVVIHTVDDVRTEQAAGFLRYLRPRQGAYRQCTYLSRKTHGKLFRIVWTLGVNSSTIGGYIENVPEEHPRAYEDGINALIRRETS